MESIAGMDNSSWREAYKKIVNEKPEDRSGTHRDGWWYSNDCYDEEGALVWSRYVGFSSAWIDEDKDNNRDGLFYRYNFASPDINGPVGFLYPNRDLGNGSCYNEEGIWMLNGEIQTLSERPWKEGTIRGLWTGVYWDRYHKSRLEVDTDELVRYYEDGKETPSMVVRIVRREDSFDDDPLFWGTLTYHYVRLDENQEIPKDDGSFFLMRCQDSSNGKLKKGDIGLFGALKKAGKEYEFYYEEGSAPKEESPAMTE